MHVAVWTLATLLAAAPAAHPPGRAGAYAAMVRRVAAMNEDQRAVALVARRKLDLLNVLWEDTGRWLDSSLGPNISDVTIEVELEVRGRKRTALMPVIRAPNFTDVTGDVPLDKLLIPVGNQVRGWKPGQPLEHITLRQFLAEPNRYLTLPQVGRIKGGTLLAKRDVRALVSAQAAFLPVPPEGPATFWPVIFNYQSERKDPAVLAVLVTRQGTSATVIDNVRDSAGEDGWGQRLLFNAGGQRAPLTAERLSAVREQGATSNGEAASSLGDDANLLMLVQIPLRQRFAHARVATGYGGVGYGAGATLGSASGSEAQGAPAVETAVLGHGPALGPYTELDGLTIERDPRFPVRVTVQFYQATSNGVLSASIVRELAAQIRRVYRSADYVGSLVSPLPGEPRRATAWDGTSTAPPGLTWNDFPGLVERVKSYGVPWRDLRPAGPWRTSVPPNSPHQR
jgi:hypothetical protein